MRGKSLNKLYTWKGIIKFYTYFLKIDFQRKYFFNQIKSAYIFEIYQNKTANIPLKDCAFYRSSITYTHNF